MPESMQFTEAAALPVAFATAYYALIHIANIQPGETVLIHSGAGGLGLAAIVLVQRRKARVLTTVGSDQKRILLTQLYSIPDEHVFSSRSIEFPAKVLKVAPGGVDVVLNSLRGEF